jgi:hypothetical protein
MIENAAIHQTKMNRSVYQQQHNPEKQGLSWNGKINWQ